MIPAVVSMSTLGLNLKQIKELAQTLNEWIVQFQVNDEMLQGKLGGQGKIVEFDESCFFRRKYHRGRVLKQIWALE